MTDDEIRAECMRRDNLGNGHIVYFISSAFGTYKMCVQSMYWNMMSEPERWCMVKYGNVFDSEEEGHMAIGRALQK